MSKDTQLELVLYETAEFKERAKSNMSVKSQSERADSKRSSHSVAKVPSGHESRQSQKSKEKC